MLTYHTWVQGRLAREPVELHDEVMISSWGLGARLMDIGVIARVVKINRTRVKITGTCQHSRQVMTWDVSPDVLRLIRHRPTIDDEN